MNIKGFIFPPTINTKVEFKSIFLRVNIEHYYWTTKTIVYDIAGNEIWGSLGPPVFAHSFTSFFENINLPKNYLGKIGLFWIDATFTVGED